MDSHNVAPLGACFTRAVDWLLSRQDARGAWLMPIPLAKAALPSPTVTALAVFALALHGRRDAALQARCAQAIDRALDWLQGAQLHDGSFGEGPDGQFYQHYATGLALMALAGVKREQDAETTRRTIAALRQAQKKDGIHRGGLGFGVAEPFPDGVFVRDFAALGTTAFAAHGLNLAGIGPDDEFWRMLVEYCRTLHNSLEINRSLELRELLAGYGFRWGDDGGLINALPLFQARSGSRAQPEAIIAAGGATCQGLRFYLFGGLPRESLEVTTCMRWIRSHYSVTSHANLASMVAAGQKPARANEAPTVVEKDSDLAGLYYYYYAMAYALDAYGEHPLTSADGVEHAWASEIAAQLIALQEPDGPWVNANPRWLEFDKLFSTAFALIAGDVVARYVS